MAEQRSKQTTRTRRAAATSPTDEHHGGGETHQSVGEAGDGSRLTTAQGAPIADDQNTLTAGDRGPQVLEDFVMREKIFHFDHERIPERVVHARGFGVKGYFEPFESLSDITSADLFQRAGERTDVFVRFSTVAGNKGSFDLARDVRGFAVKFYTKEGNWDLVGNNIPVFFIQDAIKFPDLIHAAKPEPDRGWPQAQTAHDNFWDFVGLMPESMHMIMWIMSDRAIPRSFRFMEGFGVHTFRLVNADGESTYVKFHWKPEQALQSVVWNEAVKINGADPDFHRRDIWNTIQSGSAPEWELCIQTFDDEFADSFEFDVLDATKIIPEEQIPVGRSGEWCSTRWSTTSSPRPNRWPSVPRTSFRVSTSRTIRSCRAATSRISTPSSSGWARRTSPTSRSTRLGARWRTSNRTVIWRCTTRRHAPTTNRTRGARPAGHARIPPPATAPFRPLWTERCAASGRRRSPTISAKPASST